MSATDASSRRSNGRPFFRRKVRFQRRCTAPGCGFILGTSTKRTVPAAWERFEHLWTEYIRFNEARHMRKRGDGHQGETFQETQGACMACGHQSEWIPFGSDLAGTVDAHDCPALR